MEKKSERETGKHGYGEPWGGGVGEGEREKPGRLGTPASPDTGSMEGTAVPDWMQQDGTLFGHVGMLEHSRPTCILRLFPLGVGGHGTWVKINSSRAQPIQQNSG